MMPVSRVAWLTSPVPLLLLAAVLLLLLLLCALPVPGNECDVVPLMPLPNENEFQKKVRHKYIDIYKYKNKQIEPHTHQLRSSRWIKIIGLRK